MPSAGNTRPKTMLSGILTTPRQSPVSTMTLRTTLVKRPKNPFQSPSTHQAGPFRAAIVSTVIESPSGSGQNREQRFGRRNPAEDPALRLDHREPRGVERVEIGGDAILEHEAVEAAVVGLAHCGVDADFGGDAAHHQLE